MKYGIIISFILYIVTLTLLGLAVTSDAMSDRIKLCDDTIGDGYYIDHVFNREVLVCQYIVEKTACVDRGSVKTQLEEKVVLIERVDDNYVRVQTNSGTNYEYHGKVNIDDILVIEKTTQTLAPEILFLEHKLDLKEIEDKFKYHAMIAKPVYEYFILNDDVKKYSVSKDPTYCQDHQTVTYNVVGTK